MKARSFLIQVLFISLFIIFPAVVFGQDELDFNEIPINPDNFGPSGRFFSIGGLATTIIQILTSIAAVLSFIFIIIAGFKFVTSSGDEKKLASAQGTLTYAIIGIAVTILAFVILKVVQYVVGSNVPIT